jgi:hypothetical protein
MDTNYKKTLSSLGFFPLNQGSEPGKEVRYFKPYEAIGRILFFDMLSGELLAFDLGTEEDVVKFQVGELIIRDEAKGLFSESSASKKYKSLNVCALINVNRVVMIAELKEAVTVYERLIELYLNYPDLPFGIGDRVVYEKSGTSQIGQIEEVDDSSFPAEYHIRTASGRLLITFLAGNIKKLETERRAFDFYHNLKTFK